MAQIDAISVGIGADLSELKSSIDEARTQIDNFLRSQRKRQIAIEIVPKISTDEFEKQYAEIIGKLKDLASTAPIKVDIDLDATRKSVQNLKKDIRSQLGKIPVTL